MSRDSAVVMLFYMRLEKHIYNSMSHIVLFGLAVLSFEHCCPCTWHAGYCEVDGCSSYSAKTWVCGKVVVEDMLQQDGKIEGQDSIAMD